MQRARLHNLLFALVLGVVLGITAWSVLVREPGLFRLAPVLKRMPVQPTATQPPIEAGTPPPAPPMQPEIKAKGLTEKLIESGALSDHRAKYWRRLEEQ